MTLAVQGCSPHSAARWRADFPAAAAAREESRGAHWREDFPETRENPEILAATLTTLEPDNRIARGWQPVAFTRIRPGQSLLAAEARA